MLRREDFIIGTRRFLALASQLSHRTIPITTEDTMAKPPITAKAKKEAPSSKAANPSFTEVKEALKAMKSASKAEDLSLQSVQWAIDSITDILNDFIQLEEIDNSLTGQQRRRLFGAGVRNYGFIEKSWDIVRDNPDFAPQLFNVAKFGADITVFDRYRQLYLLLEKFIGFVSEAMLVRSDVLFRDALRVYGNLRELSRARVPGADPFYRALLQFFRRGRRAEVEGEEPTLKELEKDFKKLMHGSADGEIVIKNEKPRVIAGTRKVVDKVSKGHAAVKETAEASIVE